MVLIMMTMSGDDDYDNNNNDDDINGDNYDDYDIVEDDIVMSMRMIMGVKIKKMKRKMTMTMITKKMMTVMMTIEKKFRYQVNEMKTGTLSESGYLT